MEHSEPRPIHFAPPFKVLHTIRQGQIGGGETHLLNLIENIDRKLFDFVVLSFSDGEMMDRLNAIGIKNYVLKTEKPFDIFKWSDIRELIKLEKPDIIHAHGTRACSNSYKSALKLNIPLVYTIHGWSFHQGQKRMMRILRENTESYLCGKTKVNICVSTSNLEEGQRLFGLKNARVIVNGVDLNKFNPDLEYNNIRNEFQVSSQTILVGYIARITEQKDPFTFIRAVEIVVSQSDNIEFFMVGSGHLFEKTVELAKELNVSAYIKFLNSRVDIPEILNSIDIFCLPSLWEGMPIGVLEAMAMKKAVIATGVDGTKEIISTGENGLLIEPGNAHQLANAILLLSKDEELKRKLCENARKTIEQKYNVTKMAAQVTNLYKELLK